MPEWQHNDRPLYILCMCVCVRVSVCMARWRKHVILYCANISLLVHMPRCNHLPCRLHRLMPNIERLWILFPQTETMSQGSFKCRLTQNPLSGKSAQRRLSYSCSRSLDSDNNLYVLSRLWERGRCVKRRLSPTDAGIVHLLHAQFVPFVWEFIPAAAGREVLAGSDVWKYTSIHALGKLDWGGHAQESSWSQGDFKLGTSTL